MLAEFFDRIVNLGKKSQQVEFHEVAALPTTVFVRNGDQLTEKTIPPEWRRHQMNGFDDFVAVLRDKSLARAPEVFVGNTSVIAHLDRNDRRETVAVLLRESKRLVLCAELQALPRKFQPREAVKMLRLELHGGNHDHVIQSLSRVDFTRTSQGKTDVAHGRESLGKSVEAVVQQAESVPQKFTIGVPLWTNPGFSRYGANIEFGLHLDLEGQTVELRVFSDEVARVMNLALAAVAIDLREALPDVPVFMGAP